MIKPLQPIRKQKAKGFTLVEMLVVMAILGLLAAITVPTFVRRGAFSRDELGSTARTVLNLLRSAQVYSATFRVDTAVVYFLNIVPDSRDNTPQMVVDGVTLARRASAEEYSLLPGIRQGDEKKAFILVGDQVITKFDDKVVIQARVENIANSSVQDQLLGIDNPNISRQGLFPVRLYRRDMETSGQIRFTEIKPRSNIGNPSWAWTAHSLTEYFPGHVFRSTGELRTDRDEVPGRVELRLNFSPTMNVEERFLRLNEEVKGIRIQINRFTGRAQIVEES